MSKLIRDAEKTPFSHVIIITLFAVGLISVPLEKLFFLFIESQLTARLIGGIIMRVIVATIALIFIYKYHFNAQFSALSLKNCIVAVVLALIVAINNAPIIGLINGNVKITATAVDILLYVLYCISIGFAEEFAFRGLIFPLCLKITENRKLSAFWAIVLNATVFSLSHLINLFNGYSVGAVFMQLGYTFLIGAMCAIIFALTKNIFFAVAIHVVYDLGGLMPNTIASGNQWDIITIIITVVISVIVCAYMVYRTLKLNGSELKNQYFTKNTTEN
jgi:membrane protease YdiL (CAAX protease family)